MGTFIFFAALAVLLWWFLRQERATDDDSEAYKVASYDYAPSKRQFRARLSLSTPRRVLDRHGEVWEGQGEPPSIEDPSHGWWGFGGSSRLPTPVGDQPADGGRFLEFLRLFRGIVEGPGGIDEKIEAIQDLVGQDPVFRRYAQKLGDDFPESWFAQELTAIHGVGPGTATALFRAGFRDFAELAAATDEELKAVHGVGPSTVNQIRSHIGSSKPKNSDIEEPSETPPSHSRARVERVRDELAESFGHQPPDGDVRWRILNEDLIEAASSAEWDAYCRIRISMAQHLRSEGRKKHALRLFLAAAYLQINGPRQRSFHGNGKVTTEVAAAVSELATDLDLEPSDVRELFRSAAGRELEGFDLPVSAGSGWDRLVDSLQD